MGVIGTVVMSIVINAGGSIRPPGRGVAVFVCVVVCSVYITKRRAYTFQSET